MAIRELAQLGRTTMAVMKLAAFALAALLLAGCGSSDDTRPGNPDVYERIAAETDCAKLQAGFDTADRNHDRDIQRGSDLAEVDTAYMQAYQDRMDELGC